MNRRNSRALAHPSPLPLTHTGHSAQPPMGAPWGPHGADRLRWAPDGMISPQTYQIRVRDVELGCHQELLQCVDNLGLKPDVRGGR